MSFWQTVKRVPALYPFTFGVVISTVKTSASDLIVQKVVQQKEEIDWRRNAAFATFGCFYLGGIQYALYVKLFGRIFPGAAAFSAKSIKDKAKDTKGLLALFGQVFIDQCIHHPLLYFPVFYYTKEVVMSDKPSVTTALSHYQENMGEDLKALWKIWVPSTIINFAFMPMHGRIPWVAGTSFIWTMILSFMRGGAVTEGDELESTVPTGKSLEMFRESLNDFMACPLDMDREQAHLCISASGPEQVGWVPKVARTVSDLGGNVTHSRMVRFGQEFTILMHVSVAPKDRKTLVSGLNQNQDLESLNLRISSLTRRQTGMYVAPTYGLKIHCVGEDKVGMLASIAENLNRKDLAIENIVTELRQGKNGRRDFVVNTDVTTTLDMNEGDLGHLLNEIESLKSTLGLDVLDIRVHKM